jgi:hypothetical protein
MGSLRAFSKGIRLNSMYSVKKLNDKDLVKIIE